VPIIYPVAGGKGGIGKSFISANLGWLLAKQSKTVLLVDLDLGSANLHTMMGIKNPRVGLNDFLNKTKPTLMEAVIPSQLPGLFLLSAKSCPMEAANLPYAQIQKIINAINGLPFNFVLLDLGAGTHFNTLDFFLTSTDVVLVFTQEPTSIESGIRFIETVYYRILKHLFKQEGIEALIKTTNGNQAPALSQLIPLLIKTSADKGRDLLERLGDMSFKLIVNQARNQNGYQLGEALAKLCQRHFYSRFELIGTLDYDEKILDAIISKQLFVRKFPHTRTAYDLSKTMQNLISPPRGVNLPADKPFFERNYYEILEIHRHALSGEVHQAHQTMSALYRDNPMVTDVFFGAEELDAILRAIDLAAEVLSDPIKKHEYDHSQFADDIASGNEPRLEKEDPSTPASRQESGGIPPGPDATVAIDPEAGELSRKIAAQPVISGLDLKTLRQALGISFEEMFEKTRIGLEILRVIEGDQFEALPPPTYLKGFLKAYAGVLGLAAEEVVAGYLKNMEKREHRGPETPN